MARYHLTCREQIGNTIILDAICPFCSVTSMVQVHKDHYSDWKERRPLIQDAFPSLTARQKELILTGICQDCWNELPE